ncbi:MAG: lasso peptide biosynthesis B2 protein [Gemmatimonadetes bacterium]|nr:lasso peptide biosynthesis B2 protein [Gemmatimonadota bacterium]
MRLVGLGRWLRWSSRWTGKAEDSRQEHGAINATVRRVAVVAAFFPGRALCLEQSAAIHLLLRRRGIPVTLRLAVKPYPFSAHAWVELRGRPVNELEEAVRGFVLLPELGG